VRGECPPKIPQKDEAALSLSRRCLGPHKTPTKGFAPKSHFFPPFLKGGENRMCWEKKKRRRCFGGNYLERGGWFFKKRCPPGVGFFELKREGIWKKTAVKI